jgi:hypothetical protein
MVNPVSEIPLSKKNDVISWKKEKEIMSSVEGIGDRMIKRFANERDANVNKINKGKITSNIKLPLLGECASPSNQDLIGLRKDYRLLLDEKEGFPWDQIKEIKKPHLQELLVSLHLLEKCDRNTLEFALFIAKEPSPTITLGQLLYLADKKGHLKVSIKTDHESKNWIQETYQENINVVIEKLRKHYLSHLETHVQSPEIALMTQLSVELAQLLLTQKGAVNFAIIPSLLREFVDDPDNPKNHEINIVYTFQRLLQSSEVREKIAKITRPETEFSPSNLVIRAVLDLPGSVLPTDLHAQQTALSGLLSHVRQGVDGSCFATPLVAGLLSSNLELCLSDFSSLLSHGMLTRKVQYATKDFPYLLRMNNKSLNLEITINRQGQILDLEKDDIFIWQIPGFIKACDAIGLKDLEVHFKKIIQILFLEVNKYNVTHTITVRKVLQELSKLVASSKASSNAEFGLIFSTAYFAFEGQICNALLGVWENAIAGMAEGDESSMVTSTIINTIMLVLRSKCKNIELIEPIIKDILRQRIQLHYDPMIHHVSPSKDQHTTEGAFVLYDRGEYAKTTSWIRVDDPNEFKAFISRVIEKAKQSLSKEQATTHDKLFEELLSYSATSEFLQNILNQYFNKHGKTARKLSQHQKLKYTPWITKSGNNFSKVIQVYFELPSSNSVVFRFEDQRDLFLQLANFAKRLSVEDKRHYAENPHRCLCARIPGVHAFSLMLGHPSFSQTWMGDCNLENWLDEKVIEPGRKISQSLIDESFRAKLLKFTQEQLIDDDQLTKFKIEAKKIPKVISICDLRNHLVRITNLSSKNLQLLDSYLYQSLPDANRKILNETAVHIGDTNWSDGLQDLHFCFVVNPGSGKLEIWAVHDDLSGMQSLDQSLWLQEWEIFK